MKRFKFALLAGAMALSTAAMAETTTTVHTETLQQTTVERQLIAPGIQTIELTEFDVDSSGVISLDEIARRLFHIYDTDNNEVIDNVEFRAKRLVTFVPVEREIITMADLDGDGVAEEVTYNHETFMQQTRLSMFDRDNDGLTAHEFIGQGFVELDVNRDQTIDLQEWQSAYKPAVKPIRESQAFN